MNIAYAPRGFAASLALCLAVAFCSVACSSGSDSKKETKQQENAAETSTPSQENPKPEPEKEEPKNYNVTGNWMMPNKPSIMSLKQNSSSIRGTITELQNSGFDPCTAKVVGSIKDGLIEMDEIFICPDNPELEITVHKSGKMVSENHMALTAVDGPHPGTTQWYR
ncbi:MAG: hypothetical protein PHF14_01850 [Verrucomicrobiota bacterium]|nr:hypothetical protein [Verrucomicrobiota bacterium]